MIAIHDTRNLTIKTVSFSLEYESLTQGQYFKFSSSLYHTVFYCSVDENQTKFESISEKDYYISLRAQMSVILKRKTVLDKAFTWESAIYSLQIQFSLVGIN